MTKKCVVLLSGGLDSTTTLYYAKKHGFDCYALIFNYGQRHNKEVRTAVKIAKYAKIDHKVLNISLPWKGSSLIDKNKKLPSSRSMSEIGHGIPSTYVPARNTIFLSFALSYAEAIGADSIFIGANAIDYSGYPDCRPNYYKAFQKVINTGVKAKNIKVKTPLLNMVKSDIVRLGRLLKAPLDLTWSCYKGGSKPCGVCDSCLLRDKGFKEAGKGK